MVVHLEQERLLAACSIPSEAISVYAAEIVLVSEGAEPEGLVACAVRGSAAWSLVVPMRVAPMASHYAVHYDANCSFDSCGVSERTAEVEQLAAALVGCEDDPFAGESMTR